MKKISFIPFQSFNVTIVAFLLIVLFAQGCEKESKIEIIREHDQKEIDAYLENNNISAEKHSSGIYYERLVSNPSNQQVSNGFILDIKYSFSVLNGNSLNIDNDTIIAFEQGYSNTMPYGFDIGCGLMRNGERFRLYIPSWLAFGQYENSNFNLQSNAILICEIEIVDMHSKYEQLTAEIDSITKYVENNNLDSIETYPNELYFMKINEVQSGVQPQYGDWVSIHFVRKYLNGNVHFSTYDDNNPKSFKIGNNAAVKGLEEGIKLMNEGEEALLILPSEIAFGSSNQVIPYELRKELIDDQQIYDYPEPFSPIIYEIKLISVN